MTSEHRHLRNRKRKPTGLRRALSILSGNSSEGGLVQNDDVPAANNNAPLPAANAFGGTWNHGSLGEMMAQIEQASANPVKAAQNMPKDDFAYQRRAKQVAIKQTLADNMPLQMATSIVRKLEMFAKTSNTPLNSNGLPGVAPKVAVTQTGPNAACIVITGPASASAAMKAIMEATRQLVEYEMSQTLQHQAGRQRRDLPQMRTPRSRGSGSHSR